MKLATVLGAWRASSASTIGPALVTSLTWTRPGVAARAGAENSASARANRKRIGRAVSRLSRATLPHERAAFGEIVADRRCGDAGLAHCVADLVEPLGDVTRRVEPGYAGALVRIDLETAVAARLGAEVDGQFGADHRTERGIDRVERQVAIRRRHDDAFAVDTQRLARAVDRRDAQL